MYVLSCQSECCQIVVKDGGFPCVGDVAGTAILTQVAIVNIFCCVAGIAVAGGAFENIFGMTAQAAGSGVLACQFEIG
jgi:hypothetical protein